MNYNDVEKVINGIQKLYKNEMRVLLGEEYHEENHILNWIKYWIKGSDLRPTEEWRMQNDLDCIYLKTLNADTIVSIFKIMERVVRCINDTPKIIKEKECLAMFLDEKFFNELLPQNDLLVQELQLLSYLAELRLNYMVLPNRFMQKRGIWYADEMPPTLYQCFEGGKFYSFFGSIEEIRRWIINEDMEMLFRDGEIKQENIIPINEGFPVNKSMKNTKRRDLLEKLITYDISMLTERGKKMIN